MNKRRALQRYQRLWRQTEKLAAAHAVARQRLLAFERLTCLPESLKLRLRREASANRTTPRRSLP